MVIDALYILAAGLGSAFLLGVLGERQNNLAYMIALGALSFMSMVSAMWLVLFVATGAQPIDILTAGTRPPFAINLRMGLIESALMLAINLTGLLTAMHMGEALLEKGRRAMAVLLVAIMALCGTVLTRDIFNLFVFLELIAISTGGLLLLSDDENAVAAGFKYLIVSQFISILLLIGIVFGYHASGTLNIDGMAAQGTATFALAFFLILIAIVAELKPFPANGWALDIYESAHPGFAAVFSAATGTALLFAADKVLAIGGPDWYPVATGVGILTFVASNLFALPQTGDRRLLGYSSIAQTGLILAVIGQQDILGERYLFIAGGLLLAHAVAKAGLFWLSAFVAERRLTAWAALKQRPLLVFAFVTFIAMLTGLPPFPGFYAKWELVHALAAEGRLALLALILFGALVEAGYLFRWFGYLIKREAVPAAAGSANQLIPVVFAALAGWGLAFVWGRLSGQGNLMLMLPLLFALAFLLIEWAPAWAKNIVAIGSLSYYFLLAYADYDPLRLIFLVIFTLGGAIIFLASFHAHGRRIGFYPAAMLMFAGMVQLIAAGDSFGFFAAWELLTVGSYFLILRGKESEPHALSYIVFSLGGAFLILTGFALAAAAVPVVGSHDAGVPGAPTFQIARLAELAQPVAPWVFLLLAIGFMTKTAAIGLHIWLPGAHAEAETDVSPMVSGILLKAGLYGLFVLLINMGKQSLYGVELTYVMLWIGAVTALLGNLMAIFQEDGKRLLAYSSIGQMGYALFGLALMNHLGWLMALMFVINHYVYKSMLFLSVGGVAKRTGTREMYRMGGLITLMPLSFIAVLIGIIAMSGVPPLSGFGGRWIFYNAIMTADARLPMVLIFLSGPIAFLYLFRLIHTIFLGQLKDEHRRIKEAPFWIVLPQMLFVATLLGVALFPGLILRRADAYIGQFFPEGGLNWDGLTITSPFGWWNPVAIMIVVACIFGLIFAWLLFVNRRAQKVKQFNIVFSAERPYRPETTHFAWNFFAPYRKAMGFLVQPFVTRFWGAVTDLLHTAGDLGRRLYNGNGQIYAFHFLVFVVVVFMMQMGI